MADIKINEKLVVSQTGTAEPVLASNVDLSSATGIPAAGIIGVLPVRNENLIINRVSNSTIDIDADYLTLLLSSGVGYIASSINLTIDITASGANGLDTGSEGSSTWYYIWVIYNGTTVAGLFSTSATAPTMPAGYTYKKFVGAVRNNSSSNFLDFHQRGNDVMLTTSSADHRVVTNGTATSYTSCSLVNAVPPNAHVVKGWMGTAASNERCLAWVAATSSGRGEHCHDSAGTTYGGCLSFEIVLVETQTLYYKIHSSLGLNVDIYPTGHRFAGIV